MFREAKYYILYVDIMYTRGHGWVAEPARITDFIVAVNRVSVTAPTIVSVGSKVDIVCSWDNGDSPPRHPVVRLTNGMEKTGLKLTETSQNQKKSTQQTNKNLENNVLKITIPVCFVGHIHEVTSPPFTGELS